MKEPSSINYETQNNIDSSIQKSDRNRIDALKSLALILLHELEQMEQTFSISGKCLTEKTVTLTDDVQNYEIGLICTALLRTSGHQAKAAKILGIKKSTLHAKIKRYGIENNNQTAKLSKWGK
jgi:DNA-binding NtrC family response regulator